MEENSFNISFTINGSYCEKQIPASLLLINLIRDELKLKGTKPGCMEGECGACTVLVDGKAINSCLFPAINITGREVVTIEGIPDGEKTLDSVQESLIQHGAVQCGFCTPGMVMAIKSFVDQCKTEGHLPTREEIEDSLSGNICRCTGYTKIIDASEALFDESSGT
jgi:carbon-monoxide dehydrogenase small subunit